MDKTFEDIINETLEELGTEENNIESEEEVEESEVEEDEGTSEEVEANTEEDEETSDDDSDELEESTTDENSEENDDVEEDLDEEEDLEVPQNSSANSKDANAFAKLRVKNKQYKKLVDFFDERAKDMGLEGIDDLVAKTKEAEIAKQAKKEGIPLEYAKRLKELEEKVAVQDAENANRIASEKQARVRNQLDGFVQANGLDNKAVNKLARDLLNDGISLEFLSNIPENSIPRILKSYLPDEVSKQKELEKKEKLKKELPLNSKSKTSSNTKEDEIEKIAKALSKIH